MIYVKSDEGREFKWKSDHAFVKVSAEESGGLLSMIEDNLTSDFAGSRFINTQNTQKPFSSLMEWSSSLLKVRRLRPTRAIRFTCRQTRRTLSDVSSQQRCDNFPARRIGRSICRVRTDECRGFQRRSRESTSRRPSTRQLSALSRNPDNGELPTLAQSGGADAVSGFRSESSIRPIQQSVELSHNNWIPDGGQATDLMCWRD